jgi:hypothetical protein
LPGIKDGLKTLAAAEDADARVLRGMVWTHHVWPTRPESSISAAANNWARLSADLDAETELIRALNGAIAEWEGVNHELASRLREMVASKEQSLRLLRALALRCDPQALD